MTMDLGLIVGSGFEYLNLPIVDRQATKTPFGATSSPLLTVSIGGASIRCIARHGENQAIAPHAVNYRANLWALHHQGIRRCIAINSVGAIGPGLQAGELAIPDQLIDYTWGREHSFYDGSDGQLEHIEFAEPFDRDLRNKLVSIAQATGEATCSGICAVTQGPRLETAAEIGRLARDGCTMVGMTLLPEASLARELRIAYAACAVAVNFAAGLGPGDVDIHDQFERYAGDGMRRVAEFIETLVPALISAD